MDEVSRCLDDLVVVANDAYQDKGVLELSFLCPKLNHYLRMPSRMYQTLEFETDIRRLRDKLVLSRESSNVALELNESAKGQLVAAGSAPLTTVFIEMHRGKFTFCCVGFAPRATGYGHNR